MQQKAWPKKRNPHCFADFFIVFCYFRYHFCINLRTIIMFRISSFADRMYTLHIGIVDQAYHLQLRLISVWYGLTCSASVSPVYNHPSAAIVELIDTSVFRHSQILIIVNAGSSSSDGAASVNSRSHDYLPDIFFLLSFLHPLYNHFFQRMIALTFIFLSAIICNWVELSEF